MKPTAFLLTVLLSAARGAEPATTPEPPAKPAPTLADVAYGRHPRNVLDFYKADSDKPAPVVIYLHGGAWSGGDKKDIGKTAFEKYLAAGISVVSLNYRYTRQAKEQGVKPPVRGPMDDAARAIQFVRSKAAEWNLDKRRVAASGTSAGACTSLWLAFHDDLADPKSADPVARESTRLTAAAVLSAQTSLDPQQMKEWTPNSNYGGHAFGCRDTKNRDEQFPEFLARRDEFLPWIKEFSPYDLATPDDPPVYLIYKTPPSVGQAEKDPTHSANFGVKLHEKLKTIGVGCEVVWPRAPDVKHAGMEEFLIERLTK